MTKELIEITFGSAMSHAKKLDECADDMTRIAKTKIGNIKSDLYSTWQGDSADAYVQKLDDTAQNMLTTADKMRKTAKTIREVAQIFRTTELRAIELAQQRSY